MEPEITPQPSPEERAAILAALDELAAEKRAPDAYRSAWWREGILEGVDEDEPG